MKDFIGNELNIGDIVAIMINDHPGLAKGRIIAFTPQKVRVIYVSNDYVYQYTSFPRFFVKLPVIDSDNAIVPLSYETCKVSQLQVNNKILANGQICIVRKITRLNLLDIFIYLDDDIVLKRRAEWHIQIIKIVD